MAADITSASSAPKKSARSDEEMISLRLRGVSAAGEGVEAVKFKGIQKSFKFYELRDKPTAKVHGWPVHGSKISYG
jgi:hypothetical protein